MLQVTFSRDSQPTDTGNNSLSHHHSPVHTMTSIPGLNSTFSKVTGADPMTRCIHNLCHLPRLVVYHLQKPLCLISTAVSTFPLRVHNLPISHPKQQREITDATTLPKNKKYAQYRIGQEICSPNTVL